MNSKILLQNWIERTILALYTGSNRIPPEDKLSSTLWWKIAVLYRARIASSKTYKTALFGDSISAQIGNPFGKDFFNFAIGGMSLISLIAQLKVLKTAQFKCDLAIVAMGTNDAWYGVGDETFLLLLEETIVRLQEMGTNEIVLIPAFYSTVAASLNPLRAAAIHRIDEINLLFARAAAPTQVTVASTENLALYRNGELREDLTVDGVHLNQQGCQIYRDFLWEIYQNLNAWESNAVE